MVYVPGIYTEDGEAVLYENIILGEYFEPKNAEEKEIDDSNFIKFDTKYEDASGNYIRFLRDKYAISKLDGKLSAWFYYRNGETIVLQKLTENYEGTLIEGSTFNITVDGKDYSLTAGN
jgi:hypothetical protein